MVVERGPNTIEESIKKTKGEKETYQIRVRSFMSLRPICVDSNTMRRRVLGRCPNFDLGSNTGSFKKYWTDGVMVRPKERL